MAAKKKEVVLGCTAQDKATGFKGSVVWRATNMSGNVHFGILPKVGKDGEVKKAQGVDAITAVFVDAGISASLSAPHDFANIALGSQVRDRVSGFEGITVERVEWSNGCVYYGIQPKIAKDKPGELPETVWFDSQRVEKTGDGVSAGVRAQAERVAPRPPGGPAIGDRRIA